MSHLTILQQMFPGKILLGVEEIASLLNVSKGHIQNLCYSNRLPLKLHVDKSLSNRIQVSVVEMARYLDGKLESLPTQVEKKEPSIPSMVIKPKRGRPRGVSRTQMMFQNALRFAVLKEEVSVEIKNFNQYLENLDIEVKDEDCRKKFLEYQSKVQDSGRRLEVSINFHILEKQIGPKIENKKPVKKI